MPHEVASEVHTPGAASVKDAFIPSQMPILPKCHNFYFKEVRFQLTVPTIPPV